MARKQLFWVCLLDIGRGDGSRSYRIIFECDCETVAAVHAELREFGVINGVRIRAGNDEAGNWIVRDRRDMMFGAAAVLTVQPYIPGGGAA